MAVVAFCRDFVAQENKVWHYKVWNMTPYPPPNCHTQPSLEIFWSIISTNLHPHLVSSRWFLKFLKPTGDTLRIFLVTACNYTFICVIVSLLCVSTQPPSALWSQDSRSILFPQLITVPQHFRYMINDGRKDGLINIPSTSIISWV